MVPSAPGFPELSKALLSEMAQWSPRNTNPARAEKFRRADVFFTSPPLNLSFSHHHPLLFMDMEVVLICTYVMSELFFLENK